MPDGKKVALLLDGGWLTKVLREHLGKSKHPSDEQVYNFALGCIKQGEELFRIYYYDCYPYDGRDENPITGNRVDFRQTPQYGARMKFLDQLSMRDYIAFRHGQLQHRRGDWGLKKGALEDVCFASSKKLPLPNLLQDDIVPVFKQKGVDIKIGLDIAWLALKRIVDRIILMTNDTDFVPAMKFARREAIAIVLIDFGGVHKVLKGHTDEIRKPDLSNL